MAVYNAGNHTFVVCAYQKSEYLKECIESLLNQTESSAVIMATSTPNEYLDEVSDRYGIPMMINSRHSGIAGDWNFALSCARTALITLAHQDDIYEPQYVEKMLKTVNRVKNPIIFSSGYAELRDGEKVTSSKLLNIKKIMRIPMRMFPGSRPARRLMLAFGDPLCCPSVTYIRDIILKYPFQQGLLASLDWQQWETLSKLEGSFAFCGDPLMCHRIHEQSETSRVINQYSRTDEDYEMYRKFWPAPIAKWLARMYSYSEKSNKIR